jgi:DNA-binding transcriptional MerR regulator
VQIGELAETLGVTTKTIRHYERVGLIPPALRTRSGYRVFDDEAVKRARLVIGLRGLGLPVKTISALIDPNAPGSLRQRLLSRLDQDVQSLAIEISILQGRHDDLEARYQALIESDAGDQDCVCAATLQPCSCGEKIK